MCTPICCRWSLIFQEQLLIEEEIEICQILSIDIVLLLESFYNHIRNHIYLIYAIWQFTILPTKVLKGSLEEQPDINRLEATLITILFQQAGFFIVNCWMSHCLTLFFNALWEKTTQFRWRFIDKSIKVALVTIQDWFDDTVKRHTFQHILDDIVNTIVTKLLTDDVEFRKQFLQHLAFSRIVCHHIEDYYIILLAITVNTTHALLQAIRIPGNIPVDEQAAELKVNTFACSIRTNQNLSIR